MSAIDYTRADTLDLALFAPESPIASGIDGIEGVLDAIEAHADGLMPDQVEDVDYSREAVRRELRKQRGSIKIILSLIRRSNPEVYYSLSFVRPELPISFWLWMVAPLSFFTETTHAEERARVAVELVRALADACHPAYGYCHSKGDLSLGSDPHPADPLASNAVYEMYWLNLYGPEMVERIGRDRILSTPASYVEELPYGGVLLLTRPTPADFATDEARLAQASALAHLRDDVAQDAALARLRERSAILAPVQREWDPDIADLLLLTLDDVPFAHRERETARLNQYRPPMLSEWIPLSDLRPSDVDDPGATVERYSGLYAEQLAALLHTQVPEVMRGDPDSLPRIDYHFWRYDYPGSFRREDIENDLVPAIGAYLGQVLVRHLGGQWVPRRNLDESQVVVGDRVWLPFLRARDYMQSKQSALDHSLTQFYRGAERFARTRGTAPSTGE